MLLQTLQNTTTRFLHPHLDVKPYFHSALLRLKALYIFIFCNDLISTYNNAKIKTFCSILPLSSILIPG